MGFTSDLHVASAYCALGHTLQLVDPVAIVQMPDGSEHVSYNFEEQGQDSRFSRQAILEAIKSTPDAASTFDDLIAGEYPELAERWHAALAAAAARGATHCQAIIALCDFAPVMLARDNGGGSYTLVNADATDEQIKQIARL